MALTTMYAAQTNSPTTTLASAAGAADTSLIVTSAAVLPSTPPFELSLGIGEAAAETVLVTAVNGNTLTVTRGWDGTPQAWAVNTVCARTFSARDLNDMQSNISALSAELGALVDTTLTEQGKAADAYTTGRALYGSKDRDTNTSARFTYWDIADEFTTGATPADVPINSYTEAAGSRLSGFSGLTLGSSTLYLLWCWITFHNTAIRYYILIGRSTKECYIGRTTNSGATVTWTDWSQPAIDSTPTADSSNLVTSGGVYAAIPAVDTGLSTSGAAADAAVTGTAIYGTKNRTYNIPARFTWWKVSDAFTDESPASPSDMPINSYCYASGSRLAGFNNSVFTLTSSAAYYVWCWGSLYNTAIRFYQIISASGQKNYIGRTLNSGSTVTWGDRSPQPQKTPSIMFFGDSIVRGSNGSSLSPNRIPDIVASELGVRCENFGIGNIGWVAEQTSASNKTTALGYLQRVGDPTFYDPNDTLGGYKFLGSGDWSDFNAIVIFLGPNDLNHPLGSIQDDIITPGLDNKTYDEIMALSNPSTKISIAMYQCYRYIRNISSTINIIISDPILSSGGANGTPPLWGYTYVGSGGWSRLDLCQFYTDFCYRYGLGHIQNFDAPMDRVDVHNSLSDSVHPKNATYSALGLHFAGKIGALIL